MARRGLLIHPENLLIQVLFLLIHPMQPIY